MNFDNDDDINVNKILEKRRGSIDLNDYNNN